MRFSTLIVIGFLICAGASAQTYGPPMLDNGALTIDGQPYADLEGKVVSAYRDLENGDVTILVETARGRAIRFLPGGDQSQLKTLGHARSRGTQAVLIVDDNEMLGNALIVLARGVALPRPGAVVRLFHDGRLQAFPLPQGWERSSVQPGNVVETELYLVHRPMVSKSGNPILRGKQTYEYALMDLATGKLTAIPVQAPAVLNFNQYSNDLHKRLDWERIGDRRFAASLDATITRLVMTDVDSGMSYLVKKRMLGLDHLKLYRSQDSLVLENDGTRWTGINDWFDRQTKPYVSK